MYFSQASEVGASLHRSRNDTNWLATGEYRANKPRSIFWSKVDHVCRVKAVCYRTLVDDFEGSVGSHLDCSPHEVFSTRKFDFYPTTNCVN